MIITKCTDGLGNQLFQYALGRRLSILHNTDLFIDRTDFNNNPLRSYCLNYFNVQSFEISDYKNFALQYPVQYLKLKLGLIKMINESSGEPLPIDKFTNNSYLKGYWGSEQYFSSMKGIVLKEFTLKKKWISSSFMQLKAQLAGENTVSIHIRRGDYLKPENKRIFQILGAEYYKNALAFISAQVENPVFYIFSDDLEWVKKNFTILSGHHFINEDKQLTDYEELMLMSYCRHNIIANSTFSWWAAWLNANKDKIVIQPEHWYTDPVLQNDYNLNRMLFSEKFIRI